MGGAPKMKHAHSNDVHHDHDHGHLEEEQIKKQKTQAGSSMVLQKQQIDHGKNKEHKTFE